MKQEYSPYNMHRHRWVNCNTIRVSLSRSFWFTQQTIPLRLSGTSHWQLSKSILSTLPFPVVIMRQEGNFQKAACLFAIYNTDRVSVGFRVWLED